MNTICDDLEDYRIEKLQEAAEAINQSPTWHPELEPHDVVVSESYTELLTYESTLDQISLFSELNDPDQLHELWLPQSLQQYIKKGDTFMMIIGKVEGSKIVLFCSQPYFECLVQY